jgi:glycerate 2-kinase
VTAGGAGIEELHPPALEPVSRVIGDTAHLVDHGLAQIRLVALDVAATGLRAADPALAVDRLVHVDGQLLKAGGRFFDLDKIRSVVLLGAGKASLAIAAELERKLGDRITRGLIVALRGTDRSLDRIDVVVSDHPVPTWASVEAASRLLDMVRGLGPGDLLITAFTGGSSALVSMPPDGVPFAAKQWLHSELLKSGASIAEINAVRKHVSAIKGGRLAERAGGAAILNLTVSDVVGDVPDLLCDPTVQDTSTSAGAIAVLKRHGLWADVPGPVKDHLSRELSASPSLIGQDITTVVLVAGGEVAEQMARRVHALGWQPVILGSQIEGDAASLGGFLGALAAESSAHGRPFPPGVVLVAAGGEAIVTMGSSAAAVGRGGPNQELALAFARAVAHGPSAVAGVFLDSDGFDGGTDAAGGCVDSETAGRAAASMICLDDAIAWHESRAALTDLGDLIKTGPTGTNISDLWVIAIDAADMSGSA